MADLKGILSGPTAQGVRQGFGQEFIAGMQSLQQQEQELEQRNSQEAKQTDEAITRGLAIFNALDKAGADDATKQKAWKAHVSPHIDEVDSGVTDINQLKQINKVLGQRQELGAENAFEAIRAINPVTGQQEEAPQPTAGLSGELPPELLRQPPEEAAGVPTFRPSPEEADRMRVENLLVQAGVSDPKERAKFKLTGKLTEDVSTGKISKESFDKTLKLQDRFVKNSGEFVKIRDSFGRIQAASTDPSAAGDLALIFNFMKMLDPGSVVRESEFATASNAAGVPDRVRNTFNRILRGERLAEAQRKDFVGRSGKLFEKTELQQAKNKTEFTRLAKSFGLKPEQVIIDLSLAEEPEVVEQPTGGNQVGRFTVEVAP